MEYDTPTPARQFPDTFLHSSTRVPALCSRYTGCDLCFHVIPILSCNSHHHHFFYFFFEIAVPFCVLLLFADQAFVLRYQKQKKQLMTLPKWRVYVRQQIAFVVGTHAARRKNICGTDGSSRRCPGRENRNLCCTRAASIFPISFFRPIIHSFFHSFFLSFRVPPPPLSLHFSLHFSLRFLFFLFSLSYILPPSLSASR